MIFELLQNEWNSHQHQLYFSAGVLNCRPPRPLPFILKQSNQEIGMSSVCTAVIHQNVSAKQNNGLFSAFVDSRSILNLSRSSFIQSVWVMDEKERFDEELQVTGSTPPTPQRAIRLLTACPAVCRSIPCAAQNQITDWWEQTNYFLIPLLKKTTVCFAALRTLCDL